MLFFAPRLSLPLPAHTLRRGIPLLLDLSINLHLLRLIALLVLDAERPVGQVGKVCTDTARYEARRLRNDNRESTGPIRPSTELASILLGERRVKIDRLAVQVRYCGYAGVRIGVCHESESRETWGDMIDIHGNTVASS